MPTAQSTSASTAPKNKNVKSVQATLASNPAVQAASVATASTESSTTDQQELQQQQHQSSNQTSGGNKTPQEQPEFIKQVLIIIEKKVRNLEKRRIKLEEYKDNEKKGQKLNEDQQLAVSRYDEVLRTLELSRELEKQFVGLANDAMKQQKKQAKKEQMEREEAIREKLKEAQKLISVLDKFGNEQIRNDFLNGAHGATKISQQELNILDEFDHLIEPCNIDAKLEANSLEVADHLLSLIDAKNKPITQLNQALNNETSITYSDLKKLFDRLSASSYWTSVREVAQETPAAATAILEQQTEQLSIQETTTQVAIATLSSSTTTISAVQVNELSQSNLNEEQHHHQHHHHHHALEEHRHLEPSVYQQQNTSDDYVLVNSNDFSHHDNSQKSPQSDPVNVQQQHQTGKAPFFTTLNPAELSTQFLNQADDGLNFLQDSEIQSRQQQQQQQQQEQTENYLPQQQQQEYNQIENSKENTNNANNNVSYHQQNQRNQRYQNNNNNNSGRSGPYQQTQQQRPRYQDDRRSAGGTRQQNGGNGGPPSFNNQNNRNLNGGNANVGGGYRNQSGNQGQNRPTGGGGGGGYYRGPGGQGQGNRPQGGGPRPQGGGGGYRNQHQDQQPSV